MTSDDLVLRTYDLINKIKNKRQVFNIPAEIITKSVNRNFVSAVRNLFDVCQRLW